jgi:hypothetical protein
MNIDRTVTQSSDAPSFVMFKMGVEHSECHTEALEMTKHPSSRAPCGVSAEPD